MNRLSEKRIAAGLTQEKLAELAKSSRGTIAKIEGGSRNMTVKWAERFAPHLGVKPPQLMFDDSSLADAAASSVRLVTVKAHVQAGDWTESWQWDESDFYDVGVPNDSEIEGFKLYAAETRGPSMNQRYAEGTALIFTDIIETGETIIEGKRYIVERMHPDGMKEVTVKSLQKDADGNLWLMPESNDPRFQQPIRINGDSEEETIRIIGRVRYVVTKE